MASAKKAKERLEASRRRESVILADIELDEITFDEQTIVSDRWQYQREMPSRERDQFWTRMGLALHEANAEQAAAIKAAFPVQWRKAMEGE